MKFQASKLNKTKGFTRTQNFVSGFTLIETLVALAIFTASIVGLISITASGLANANFAKNKFIASYLAQEGVEMVRNMRDNAALSTAGSTAHWSAFQVNVGNCIVPNGCIIEPKTTTLTANSCGVAGGCPLYYDASGFYTYNSAGATSTVFRRKIIVVDDTLFPPDNEAKVTSVVYWTQGALQFSTTFSESLLNWIQ